MRTVIAFVLLAACGKGSEPPEPSSGQFNAQTETGPRARPTAPAGDGAAMRAQKLYGAVCAMCHGETGHGDGRSVIDLNLNPKPRDYTDPKWQASVTDDDLKKTIVLGGQATGKSAMMPAQSGLKNDPAALDELVKIIRGFAKH